MANYLGDSPLVLDTAGAAVLKAGQIRILNVEFAGYALDTDKCIIKNAAGRVVIQLDGASDLETVKTNNVGWINGLILDTLTSGVVRIYYA